MRIPLRRCVPLAVLACGVAFGTTPPLCGGENYAFLVAVGDYDLKELRPLRFTRADVVAFHQELVDSEFPPKNMVLMHDDFRNLVSHYEKLGSSYKPRDYLPEGDKIRRELRLLLGRLRPDDSIVVAFSGHGVQYKSENRSYFCPADARLEDKESLIAFDEVFTALRNCAAARKLLLVDACQNDPLSEIGKSRRTVDLDSITRPQTEPVPQGIVALFSCRAGQKSFELPELGHGVFFYHVLDGWKGNADRNGDRKITYRELAAHAEVKTAEFAALKLKVLQTPQLKTDFSGEWVLRDLAERRLTKLSIPKQTASRPNLANPNFPPPHFNASQPRTPAEPKAAQEAWARHLSTTVEIENTLGMKLRLIPPGEYRRGTSAAEGAAVLKLDSDFEKHWLDHERQHTVWITKPYLLGATEVTRGQFRRFVHDTGYVTEAEKDDEGGEGWDESARREVQRRGFSWKNTGFRQTDDHPVVNVTWNDARAFVDWLSRKEGKEYRLPSEAEWEYACRAGTMTMYPSGDDPETLATVANVADGSARSMFPNWTAIDARDGYVFTAPAGSLRANGFGLLDMIGNVSEWCSDWHGNDEYGQYANRAAIAPRGPDSGTLREVRGGGWNRMPAYCRTANRSGSPPHERSFHTGFRVAAAPSAR